VLKIAQHGLEQRARVDDAILRFEGIRAVFRVVGNRVLELDRRLAFVADGIANAEQRGDGVEEASATRGQWRIQTSLDHADDQLSFLTIDRAHERNIETEQIVGEMVM